MRIKWFPRSWVQIKTDKYIIYFDPSYMSTYYKKLKSKVIFSDKEDDILPEMLESADLILISHIHRDHCKKETINRLLHSETSVFAPDKIESDINIKFRLVRPDNSYLLDDIIIKTTFAYNTEQGSSTKKVHKKGSCVGYVLTVENRNIYFAGDTDLIPEMNKLKNIDIAFLPIGGTFTMSLEEAVQAARIINAGITIPIHHLESDPYRFKRELEYNGMAVKVLSIGEEMFL